MGLSDYFVFIVHEPEFSKALNSTYAFVCEKLEAANSKDKWAYWRGYQDGVNVVEKFLRGHGKNVKL